MGNSSNTLSTSVTKDEKKFHSFEKINIGMRGLNLSDKEKRPRHRLSETNINTRHQYFNKLNQNNKKENEERHSMRDKGSLRNSVSIMGVKVNKNNEEEFNDEYPFDESTQRYNHSYIEKPLNMSMADSVFSDNKSKISKPNSRTSSGGGGGKEMINSRKSECSYSSSSIKRNPLRKSLTAQTSKELSSFSNTKNTLILNNEQENEMGLNHFDNFDQMNAKRLEIDIKNKRKKNYLSNSSDDVLSMGRSSLNSFRDPYDPSQSFKNVNYDSASIISNLYSESVRTSSIQNNDYELSFVKNGEDLRRSYIAKLIYNKIWPPGTKEKDHNTMIIFDWDDTLLCTSFLTPNGIFNEDLELNDKEKEKLAKLEFSALRILRDAIERGDTYIITNAAPGWVEYSAERFYPSVRKIINKVKIISARGDYESIYPGDSRMWKIQAFLNMQKNFENNLVTNIICLGDSFIEMEAGHVLASKFTQAFIKTVKFRESPKPEELNKQLALVAEQFPAIFSAVKNLTIRVEKKVKR